MEGELDIIVDNVEYHVIFYYNYNSHYSATIFTKDGEYLGEIMDIQQFDSNKNERIINFIKNNV